MDGRGNSKAMVLCFVVLLRRASRMALMVMAFGAIGSKGKACSRATRVSIMRSASETVKPIAAKTTMASSLMLSSIRARTTEFADMVTPSFVATLWPKYGACQAASTNGKISTLDNAGYT